MIDEAGLPRRLGLDPGTTVFVSAAPYPPSGAKIGSVLDGFRIARHPRDADVELYFTSKRDTLEEQLPRMWDAMGRDGAIWVAWPKESSTEHDLLGNDLTHEIVIRIAEDAGLAADGECDIDDAWQAVRFSGSS